MKRLFCLFFLTILLTSFAGGFLPQVPLVLASPSMAPSDGDAWTENDNATYPWTSQYAGYNDLAFVIDNAQVGSYCLRVNMTQVGGGHNAELDLGQATDFSSYTYMVIYFRFESPSDANKYVVFRASNTSWGTHYMRLRYYLANGTNMKMVFALDSFYEYSGCPTQFTDIRYIQVSAESGAVGDLLFVDGLRFQTSDDFSPTNSPNDLYLPNIWANIENEIEHMECNTIDDTYTFLWDSSNATSGDDYTDYGIESEILGQAIFSLCLVYNYTQDSYLLDKAKLYGDALTFLRLADTYGGVRDNFNNDTKVWIDQESVNCNGWALAGISILYGMTSDASYSSLAHDIRHLLCDYLWNDTATKFHSKITPSSGLLTPASPTWSTMAVGSACTGLATYYLYVQQNSTVKTIIEKLYKYLNEYGVSNWRVLWSALSSTMEDVHYWWWAMHMSGLAFNNATYTNEDNSAESYVSWLMAHSQGYVFSNILPVQTWETPTSRTWDNWGGSCASLLLMLNYLDGDSEALKGYKVMVLDYLASQLTSHYYMPRYPNKGDYWEHNTWNGETFFLWASLMLYYHQYYKPNPYPILTTASITSSSFSGNKLTLTISGTGTSTTNIYCGDKGKPTSVSGASSWSYNSNTKIATINVAHSSSKTVVLDWNPQRVQTIFGNIFSNVFLAISLMSIGAVIVVAASLIILVRTGALSTEITVGLVVTLLFIAVVCAIAIMIVAGLSTVFT